MSKMYVILVIFLVNKIISAENSSEEKYIDLLPEKEKQEFLEKIARRIFHGVQSKDDRDGVSGEVSETELNEHSAFVDQILKEESENLRKSDAKTGNDDKTNQETVKIDKETLDKQDKRDVADDIQLVDLTLRDNKRNKRNSLKNTDEESKIVRINVGNVKTKEQDQEKEKKEKEGSDKEDIQIKRIPRSSVTNMNELEIMTESKTSNFDSGNQKDDLKDTLIASKSNLDESEQDPKSLETKVDPNSNNNNTEDVMNKHDRDFNQQSIDVKSLETRKDKNDDKINDVKNKNADYIKDSTPKNEEYFEKNDSNENSEEKTAVPLASESTTVNEPTTPDVKPIVVQTEKLKISDDITDTNENIISKARLLRSNNVSTNLEDKETEDVKNGTEEERRSDANIEIVSVAVETTNNLDKPHSSDTIKNEFNKENQAALENNRRKSTTSFIDKEHTNDTHTTEKSIDVTTLKTEVLTKASMRTRMEPSDTENSEKQTKISNNKKIYRKVHKKEKSDNDKTDQMSISFMNDMIKVIREKLKPDRYSYSNQLKTMPLHNALKSKQYKIYEVPTDKKPFIKKHRVEKNKENPYYVPIYNYSPDNAYYNPHNKLGPNADDNKEDIIDRSFEEEKYNENDSLNGRDDDEVDDKYDSDDSNIGLEETDESMITDKLKQYSIDYKRDRDPNLDRLIKGYTKYNNQRKFKFGTQKHQIKTSPYKLKLPVVVHNAKFTDIILNPYDYLDIDYNYDRNQKIPTIRSRYELPKAFPDSNEDSDTKSLKSRIRAARELLYKQEIDDKLDEKEDETAYNLDALRSINEKITDENKSIAMDYFFGRSQDATDTEETEDNHYPRERDINNNKHKESFGNENELKPYAELYNEELRSSKQTTKNFKTIRALSIAAKDLIPTLDVLMNLTRSNDEWEPYMTVLGDMVRNNAKALKQYDWLGTTVDIQSALYKLMDMTDKIQSNHSLSHQDLQLLRYTIYLHKATKKIRKLSRKSKMLPRNRKKRRGFIKESGLLNRHWLFRMMAKKYDTIITSTDFDDFNDFLDELQYYLYNLHTAVQQIANITKYNNQNWFENLKEIHLDTKRKHLLEILLHVTSIRLLDLIENAAKNGVEDFLTFVINNEKEVERTKIEMTFAQKIIDELMMD